MDGEFPVRVSDNVTAEQRALVAEYVEVHAFYGFHSDDPEAIQAVQEALAPYDPQSTICGLESLGYLPSREVFMNSGARTPEQRAKFADELAAENNGLDAFHYAERLAVAGGHRLFFADADWYDSERWYESQRRHAVATKAPYTHEAVAQTIRAGTQPFADAAALYWRVKGQGTDLGPYLQGLGMPVPRDGELQSYRSRLAANRTVQVAIETATALQGGTLQMPGNRATILLFFGGAHQDEVEAQFRNLGVKYKAIHTGIVSQYMPPRGELNAAALEHFGRDYVSYWLDGAEQDDAIFQRLLSLSWQNHQDIHHILQERLAFHGQHMPGVKGVDAIRQHLRDRMREDALALLDTFAPGPAAGTAA